MQTFKEYTITQYNDITYEDYCFILEAIDSETPLISEDNIYSLIGYTNQKVVFLYNKLKRDITLLSKQLNITKKAIIIAFIDPTIFNILKAFNYSIKVLLKSFSELGNLIRAGLFDVIRDISMTEGVERINAGLVRIDEYTDKHPILKKVTGPVLGTMLIYIWLNMTAIGNFKYDMNLSTVVDAMRGKLHIGEFFTAVDGKALLILFGTGTLISFAWLGATSYNLILAMIYTGLILSKKFHLVDKIKSKIKTE